LTVFKVFVLKHYSNLLIMVTLNRGRRFILSEINTSLLTLTPPTIDSEPEVDSFSILKKENKCFKHMRHTACSKVSIL